MPALSFPSNDVLVRLLKEGVVPFSISRAGTHWGRDRSGAEWISPFEPLERELIHQLQRFGVKVLPTAEIELPEQRSCWHELISLERVDFTAEMLDQEILFDIPLSEVSRISGELRRLRSGAISLQTSEDESHQRLWMRVQSPPYYTLSRGFDPQHDCRAYYQQSPNLWIEVGHRHPLAESIPVAKDQWLLIRSESPWERITPPDFTTETRELKLTPAEVGLRHVAKIRGKLAVTLRLVPQREIEPTEMWVIPSTDPEGELKRLVESADERTLERFQFAISQHAGESRLLLRVLKGKGPQPIWILPGEGYRSYLKLPNLFLPCAMRLETIPRRDSLRAVLAPDAGKLVWLEPTDGRSFRIQSIPISRFKSVRQVVLFQVEASKLPWQSPTIEPFAEMEKFTISTPVAPTPKPAPAPEKPVQPLKKPEPPRRKRENPVKRVLGWLGSLVPRVPRGSRGDTEATASQESISVESAVKTAIRPLEDRLQLPDSSRITSTHETLSALETRFLENLSKLEQPERERLWGELATAYEKAENVPDGILAWINAVWERSSHAKKGDAFLSTLAYGWLRAETSQARLDHEQIPLARWLIQPPRPELIRSLAAYVYWVSLQETFPASFRERLGEVQSLVETHESWLPLRAAWLMCTALAKLSHGDVLGLARTRDRLLERLLQEGLSLDLDTPAFLRFASDGVSQRFQHVRDWIIKKRERIHEWIRQFNTGGKLQQFGYDAEVENTHAYVELMLAWGLARFGEHQACERLRSRAAKILNRDDPVHRFLHDAFEFRIQQVREGKPAKGTLPLEMSQRLRAAVENLGPKDPAPYAVAKLLENSDILQPEYKLDAYWDTTYRSYFASSPIPAQLDELVRMESIPLNEAVRRLLPQILPETGIPGWMIVAKLLEVAPRLDEKLAKEVLARVPQAVEEASLQILPRKLLDRCMLVAAHFNDQNFINTLVARFLKRSEKSQDRKSLILMELLAEGTFRFYSRVGMKPESERFLSRIAEWVLKGESFAVARRRYDKDWPLALRILLQVASGWYHHGQDEQAFKLIDLTGKDLYTVEMNSRERTDLALSYAATLGHVPVGVALGRFEEMFLRLRGIQLMGTTNSHYTLSILQVVERVVVALVHPDFSLGPNVRRWLDEDEFRVRQRIHSDLKLVMDSDGKH